MSFSSLGEYIKSPQQPVFPPKPVEKAGVTSFNNFLVMMKCMDEHPSSWSRKMVSMPVQNDGASIEVQPAQPAQPPSNLTFPLTGKRNIATASGSHMRGASHKRGAGKTSNVPTLNKRARVVVDDDK